MFVIRTDVNRRGLTSTPNSICGPAAHKINKEARDTLALPAKGYTLCTPSYEWMSEDDPLHTAVFS